MLKNTQKQKQPTYLISYSQIQEFASISFAIFIMLNLIYGEKSY